MLVARAAVTWSQLGASIGTSLLNSIFAGGAVICGALVRSGPLAQPGTPSPAPDATPAQAEADPGVPA